MRSKLQFAGWLLALGMSAVVAVPCLAQGPRTDKQQNRPPQNRPEQKAQKQQRAERQQRRQENQQRQQGKQTQREAQRNANRPPQANLERRNPDARVGNNPNRPPSAYTAPPRTLTPQERQRNEQQFNRLPPQQKQEMRDRARAWGQLTPQQQNHIKNDVAPKWQQLPLDRQRAIRSRLNVLKNMPESARNQHLNDPNFTRGMSEEDKMMLRDLSHLHIGGAPEPPSE